MSKIKLEVGKTYRSRNGLVVKIIEKIGKGYWKYGGNNSKWYTESGGWDVCGAEHPEDLIEELPETRHTFKIPEGVKKVTVEHVGNRIVVEMVPEERKEPKPGDVMVNTSGSVYIFKAAVDNFNHKHYAWFGKDGRLVIGSMCTPGRPATPEEAQPLWDALKKAGKRWNAETMQVEEITEFDRILEWVERHFLEGHYTQDNISDVIESYLKHREDKK